MLCWMHLWGGKPLMLSVYHVLIRLSSITSWKVNSIWETETVYFQDVQMWTKRLEEQCSKHTHTHTHLNMHTHTLQTHKYTHLPKYTLRQTHLPKYTHTHTLSLSQMQALQRQRRLINEFFVNFWCTAFFTWTCTVTRCWHTSHYLLYC